MGYAQYRRRRFERLQDMYVKVVGEEEHLELRIMGVTWLTVKDGTLIGRRVIGRKSSSLFIATCCRVIRADGENGC